MAEAQPAWTVRSLLAWAREWLQRRGVESPRLDAELLIAHALRCDRVRLYIDHDKPLSAEELAAVKPLLQRRAEREPVAYILGVKEFYGRPFAVGKGVFVPRPETELLVQLALSALPAEGDLRALDLCAGSGAVGVTLCAEQPRLSVELVELSPAALEYTRANASRHGQGRATVLQGDLFEPLGEPEARYCAVVANPPYVQSGERARLQPEITQHEPALALYAGADGLDILKRIIAAGPRWLRAGGFFGVEIDPLQGEAVAALCMQAGLGRARVVKDLAGLDRFVTARLAETPASG
jgi:release factor glutamine methyltransferase